MAPKAWTTLAVAGLIVAAVLAPHRARAIEVKKDLYNNSGPAGPSASGPAKENPIPKAAAQQLSDTIASESDSLRQRRERKEIVGQAVRRSRARKFQYLPTMKGGHWTVTAKLQAAEYTPSKSGEGKGKPTGKQKSLVFNYRLDGSKWTEVEQPKWEDVDAGGTAAAAKNRSFCDRLLWRGKIGKTARTCTQLELKIGDLGGANEMCRIVFAALLALTVIGCSEQLRL